MQEVFCELRALLAFGTISIDSGSSLRGFGFDYFGGGGTEVQSTKFRMTLKSLGSMNSSENGGFLSVFCTFRNDGGSSGVGDSNTFLESTYNKTINSERFPGGTILFGFGDKFAGSLGLEVGVVDDVDGLLTNATLSSEGATSDGLIDSRISGIKAGAMIEPFEIGIPIEISSDEFDSFASGFMIPTGEEVAVGVSGVRDTGGDEIGEGRVTDVFGAGVDVSCNLTSFTFSDRMEVVDMNCRHLVRAEAASELHLETRSIKRRTKRRRNEFFEFCTVDDTTLFTNTVGVIVLIALC